MIRIITYNELTDFLKGFADGNLNMLVICSRGGLGKSEESDRTLRGREFVNIGGHVTPLKLYELLHDGRDGLVRFDEIDGLLSDHTHVCLLKQLCETRENKRIAWTSSGTVVAKIGGGLGYFDTRSHVLMLCNSFDILNANVAALETRAIVVEFDPSNDEILAKIKTFATDTEIVAFLEEFKDAIPKFSLRTYRTLEDLKRAGLDWQKYALQESNVPPQVREIADLLSRYDNDADRVDHYSRSRRDYYNWKSEAVEHARRRSLASKTGIAEHPKDAP